MISQSSSGEVNLRSLPQYYFVEIIGTEAEKNVKIEEIVTEVLSERNLAFEINIIDQKEEILALKLDKTPTLMINHQLVYDDGIPSKVELNEIIDRLIQLGEFKLHKILVPVDFSDTSEHALRCTIEWAEIWKADVEVIHIIPPYVDPMNAESALIMAEQQGMLVSQSEDNVNQLIARNKSSKINIKSAGILIGDPANLICEYAEEGNFNMIIIGTSGKHGFIDKLFGSVSSNVSIQSKVPVLLIPPQVKSILFHKILYSSDYSSASVPNIFYAIRFANFFGSSLDFIHVSGHDAIDAAMKELRFKRLLEEIHPEIKYKFDVLNGDNIAQELYDYASKQKVDLLITVHKSRDFWHRLTEKSLNKKLAQDALIPVLVLQQ